MPESLDEEMRGAHPRYEPMIGQTSITPPHLPKCRNKMCDRQTSAFYCCGPCGDAAEATPVYEVHAHTTSCEARFEERGPWR